MEILALLPSSVMRELEQADIETVFQKYQRIVEILDIIDGHPPSQPFPRNRTIIVSYRFIRDILFICLPQNDIYFWENASLYTKKVPNPKKKIQKIVPVQEVFIPKTECPICFSHRVRRFQETNCGHHFCLACTKKHFSGCTSCPMCRTEVSQLKKVSVQSSK
jgi:hypothetical protein